MNIYYIVCRVDNGATICGQVSIVLAHSLEEAAKLTVDYWNNQYDTVAKFVRGHEILRIPLRRSLLIRSVVIDEY